MIEIYNENCLETIDRLMTNNTKVDLIVTSPPYNLHRGIKINDKVMYDTYKDNKPNDTYYKEQCDIINAMDKILIENGVILYNLSYAQTNVECMWQLIEEIRHNTNYMIVDCITWKKPRAIPNNASPNTLTRITEFIFVLCRRSEYKTFYTNKQCVKVTEKGQKFYENIYNFIEAPNNDGSNPLNKATFSSDLVLKLLEIYAKPNSVIYDPFMGTGTTAVGVMKYGKGCGCLGSELSKGQCEYAMRRIEDFNKN